MNLSNTPVLETERLILRKFTTSDMEALFLILAEEEVNRFLPWFPLKKLEEAKAFYEKKYAAVYQLPWGYQYAICLKHDNVPIGYIGVSTDDSHDFGYGLHKAFWKKGIVTEAGKTVIEQLKKDGMPYITATHDRNNLRSGAVMERLGMRYQYTYEEQWMPKNKLVVFRMYQLNLDGHSQRVYQKYWEQSSVHFKEAGMEVPACPIE